jgi:acyl-coenzyme A thioesterase PaaI-like protein
MTLSVQEISDVLGTLVPRMGEMGFTVTELTPGHAVAEVGMDGNGNHLGTMYAGALFGIAEMLGGIICYPSFDLAVFSPTVKSLTIDFRRPATTTIRAAASLSAEEIERIGAEAEASGKSEFVLEAELTDTSGTVVATTRGVYQLRAILRG